MTRSHVWIVEWSLRGDVWHIHGPQFWFAKRNATFAVKLFRERAPSGVRFRVRKYVREER